MRDLHTPHGANSASHIEPLPPGLSWGQHRIILIHYFGGIPAASGSPQAAGCGSASETSATEIAA